MNKLVLDIGGSAIKFALMDDDAQILSKGEVPTPRDTIEHLIETILHIYESVKEDVDGIAISMPGNIDSSTGFIYTPGALLYNANTNIIDKLHEVIDLPISVENDGKSAALAEAWKGNLMGCDEGIVLILGTGIGGGIIHHGKIHKGKNFFAGEFSFLMQNFNKYDFRESFASRGSTAALVKAMAKVKCVNYEEMNGKKAFELIHQQDLEALQVFDAMTLELAGEIYNLQCILDPDKILLGGGISSQEILIEKVQEQLTKIYDHLPIPVPRANLGVCKYRNDSNLIGALYHFKLQFPK